MSKPKCEYCKRLPTRYYNKKGLCEFHYLKENPDRNRNMIDWEKLKRMKLVTEDILYIFEQEKIYLRE